MLIFILNEKQSALKMVFRINMTVILICFLFNAYSFAQPKGIEKIFAWYKTLPEHQKEFLSVYDSIEARRDRFQNDIQAYNRSGKNPDEYTYNWDNEIEIILKEIEKNKTTIIKDILYFSYLDLGYGLYGLKLVEKFVHQSLKQISPKSPIWSLEPELLSVAHRYSNNEILFNNYIEKVIKSNADSSVILFAKANLSPDRAIVKGKKIPGFQFISIDDTSLVYSSELMKGKNYLLDFWATWCQPCIDEMPRIHKVYEKYKNMNFTIVSISLDKSAQIVKEFRSKKWSMPWINGMANDENKLKQIFQITGIPLTVLINSEQKIFSSGFDLRGKNLEETLEKFFHISEKNK